MGHGTPIARRELTAMRGKVDIASLVADLDEIEALLRLPGVDAHRQKAKRLALAIARRGSGSVPHHAMELLSAIEDQERGKSDAVGNIQSAISNIRAALRKK